MASELIKKIKYEACEDCDFSGTFITESDLKKIINICMDEVLKIIEPYRFNEPECDKIFNKILSLKEKR